LRKIFLIILLVPLLYSCSVIQTMQNIARLKYRLQSANEYMLAGIPVSDKKSIKDFNAIEVLKLTSGFAKGSLPLTFILNVEAKNPNDGSGGYKRTDINIAAFPWRLFINDKETVKGDIGKPVFVPGKGESVIIPLRIEFDIAKSFKNKSLDDILALILQIGGVKGSTSNLKLMVQPVLGTPIGKIKYPDEITVVDKTFN
jgi:hypothetical protein